MKVRRKLGSRHNDATAQVDSQLLFCNGLILSFGLEDMLDGNNPSNITWPKGECSQMTYEERVEQAIAGAVRNAVGIRCGAFSGNMKVSSQAARSIG
jgi:hypothetical protein